MDFLKINSASASRNSGDSRSPCYSAVLNTNPLPDCSNYSPFCHTHYFTVSRVSPFTKPLHWRLILYCCSALLQNLVGNSCLRRSAVVPWRSWRTSRGKWWCSSSSSNYHLNSLLSLCLFSLSLSSLCSLSQYLSSPFPHFPSLYTIPSFFSDQFSVFLRWRLQVSFS